MPAPSRRYCRDRLSAPSRRGGILAKIGLESAGSAEHVPGVPLYLHRRQRHILFLAIGLEAREIPSAGYVYTCKDSKGDTGTIRQGRADTF
jgi:hypothetical protein